MTPTSSSPPIATHETLARLQSACLLLRAHLETAKRLVDEEIRNYPTPIPRCDAQFNYLYEQRSRLAQGLERISAALADPVSPVVAAQSVADFIGDAPYTNDTEETSLTRRLRDELRRLARVQGRASTGVD